MAETCSLCGTPSCLPCRPLVTPTISRVYVCICTCMQVSLQLFIFFHSHTFLLFPISRSICSDLLVHAHVHVCVRVKCVCVCVCVCVIHQIFYTLSLPDVVQGRWKVKRMSSSLENAMSPANASPLPPPLPPLPSSPPRRRLHPAIRTAVERFSRGNLHHVETVVRQSLPDIEGEGNHCTTCGTSK